MKDNQPKTMLALGLSMAIIFGYFTWFSPQAPTNPPPSPSSPSPKGTSIPVVSSAPSSLPEGLELPSTESTLDLENRDVHAQVTTKGGYFYSWVLKDYLKEAGGSPQDRINLLGDSSVNGPLGQAMGLSLGLPEEPSMSYTVVSREGSKVILRGTVGGLEITKTFSLEGDGLDAHVVSMDVEIKNKGQRSVALEPRVWVSRSQKVIKKHSGFFSFLYQPDDHILPAYYGNGKYNVETNWEKLKDKAEQTGKIYWTGLTDRYFLMALLTREGSENVSVAYGKENQKVYTSLSYGSVTLQPGETLQKNFSLYGGPKKREELRKVGSYLETSVDYGFFTFLAIPLLWLLIFLEKFLGNWGLAIIALTFIVKLLLHSVNKKSMQSMKEMQKLQPQMKALKDKYKGDNQRLNTEMMQLFKAHKVNPMGGCLPMILQFPVYIALYRVLWNAVELYHAPFYGFYKDLAAPDPYMISPILLAIFMVFQQKLTPQPATIDPAQQKIMMFMPLLFAVFMVFFPFGLVLYILVNTLVSVLQQYMIHNDLSFVGLAKKIVKK